MNYKFLILAALLFGFGCAEAADALAEARLQGHSP